MIGDIHWVVHDDSASGMIDEEEVMFKRRNIDTNNQGDERMFGFSYLPDNENYLDTACQTLRPQPVINALNEYYHEMNACGGRVKYAWGAKVDEAVSGTRVAVLDLLQLSNKSHSVSFTLNTTYGLNLLLSQLPKGVFKRIVTTDKEHNSVFLPSMTASSRLGVPRLVLERGNDGSVIYTLKDIEGAVVILNAISNIDGLGCPNLAGLIEDVHKSQGIVIIDAAQAMAHHAEKLAKTSADAVCFSAHKLYAPSLGVVVSKRTLIDMLDIHLVGGGMVQEVTKESYILTNGDYESRLEPGLQAYGEIIALKAALEWRAKLIKSGELEMRVKQLSSRLYESLASVEQFKLVNNAPSMVVSGFSEKYDAHRLAKFLSEAGVMVRSGYFCCHYYLHHKLESPPLLRFSAGLHTTDEDIDRAVTALRKFLS
jgi:selenocysteine lyase/cysteine desulfurase